MKLPELNTRTVPRNLYPFWECLNAASVKLVLAAGWTPPVSKVKDSYPAGEYEAELEQSRLHRINKEIAKPPKDLYARVK